MAKKSSKKAGRPVTTGTTPMRSLRIADEHWERWRVLATEQGRTLVEWLIAAGNKQAERDERKSQ